VGDSFAGALGLPLNKRLRDAGVRGVLQFETASYIPGWASGDKLKGYLNRYNPDLVLVTLGANELEIVNPEQRIRNIRKLVATIGARPCVWIATPLWAGAKNGLMEIIRQNAAPCLYLDTNALISDMPRVSDGIHPTLPAREDWADVVVQWLQAHRKPTGERPWTLAE
jgi:lysophospholipase L1-like esterase